MQSFLYTKPHFVYTGYDIKKCGQVYVQIIQLHGLRSYYTMYGAYTWHLIIDALPHIELNG